MANSGPHTNGSQARAYPSINNRVRCTHSQPVLRALLPRFVAHCRVHAASKVYMCLLECRVRASVLRLLPMFTRRDV